jgi:ligand-binding sensor domain-containing protein
MRKSSLILASLVLTALTAFWIFKSLREASRQLSTATTQIAHAGQFAFRRIPLDRVSTTAFESISSPALYNDAALYDGKLYICGPAGLLAFDLNGNLVSDFHVGAELPPAPLVRLAVGVGMSGVGPRLWIATLGEGFLIFDGRTFEQVRPDAATGQSVTSVLPLASGRVLFGTEKSGVLVWDGQILAQLHPSLADLHVTALAGTESDLWVGSVDQGVLHWHGGQVDRITEAEGLPDMRVLSLASTPEAAYVGTALGVSEFKDGLGSRTLASGVFAKSLLVRNEHLVIGTLEEGVVEVTLKAQQPRPRNTAESSNPAAIQRLLDVDGRLFVLAEDGLYEKNRRLFEVPGSRLTDHNISALQVDRAGKLWIGYFDRGLDVLDAGFEHRAHYEDEHLFCVNRIVHDPTRGITAVGTANGLVVFDAASRPKQVMTRADGLIANQVTDILLRSNGMTLATPAGLTMIDDSGTNSLYAFHGLVNNHVYSLGADQSKLMVGTLGGISMLDAGVVRASYTTANSGLKQNWITAIQPVNGDWFIGTYGSGVIELDSSGRWDTFPDMRGQIEINFNAMVVTPRAVYAGTLGRGLAAYGRTSGRWSFVTKGLPSANVTALAAANGYLYVGTENGLVRIPEQQLPMQ